MSEADSMSKPPSGTELIRAFLPCKDRGLSTQFYEALGFEKLLDGDVTIFATASGGFLLTDFYDEGLDGKLMMQLMVDDLDSWWTHITALDLPGRFGVPPPKPPAMQPWGLRIAYIVDPCGVLWHVAQRRKGAVQD